MYILASLTFTIKAIFALASMFLMQDLQRIDWIWLGYYMGLEC